MLDQSQSMADSGFLRTGAVADLGSREGRAPPLGSSISLNFMQFLGKFGKFVSWRPHRRVGTPTLGKSWIRH